MCGIAPGLVVFPFVLLNYYKVIMKKLLGIGLLMAWGFFLAASNSSCSSTTTPSAPDTIHLAFKTPAPNFTSIGTVDTSLIWLTCGCSFVLNMDNSGGDTSAFQIVDLDTMTTKISPHNLQVQVKPGTASGTYAAWYAYSAVDHLGGTDRDTLQISAKF